MAQETTSEQKRTRGRSPSYPGIGLQVALSRAQAVYAKEQRHPANVEVILSHWGYSPKSGAGLVTLAALKKFGLLLDQGSGDSRKGRLSEAALKILLDEEGSPTRAQLIREAALTPSIHRELWQEYGGSLPSDATLRKHLLLDKGFTESAVEEFVPQFKSTVAFAKLTLDDKLSTNDEDKQNGSMITAGSATSQGEASLGAPRSSGMRDQSVPVSRDELVIFRAAFPLSESKWQQMMAVLDVMKPTLTKPDEVDG
jgi:hypothetical protein